jgi:site-specific DNA-cytosine methylase
MNVLSLFDGMSGTQIALERLGFDVDKYYASEIDKYAIAVTQYNYPRTIQLGDINNWREWDIDWSLIDLIVGGSPCQGLSQAGRGAGLNDSRSKLFFVFIDILEHIKKRNPNVWFLLENVVPKKKEWAQNMTVVIGVEPIMIDSALLSAQSRKRLYWTNIINVPIPDDLLIHPSNIIEDHDVPNNAGWQKWWDENGEYQLKKKYSCIINDAPKAICTTARQVSSWNGNLVSTKNGLRFVTPIECERLQTAPDEYTSMGDFNGNVKKVSNTQRYKMLGNGFTVDVIAHILKNIKDKQCN